jgi:hypothetical protein
VSPRRKRTDTRHDILFSPEKIRAISDIGKLLVISIFPLKNPVKSLSILAAWYSLPGEAKGRGNE